MIIIVYSETTSALIKSNLGAPEYSYYFVLEAFQPVLETLGRVVVVTDPARQVDSIYRRAIDAGEECIFLSFSPPHRTQTDLACPTIPVFAWEFDTLPSETWFGESHQDWRFVLDKLGRGITHSSFTADVVKTALGSDFPIISIPAPVFDRLSELRAKSIAVAGSRSHGLNIDGWVVDTRNVDLSTYSPQRFHSLSTQALYSAGQSSVPTPLQLDGVVYTTVLNPYASRKNYFDMVCGFCWALRECEDATLVFKLSHHDAQDGICFMMENLYKLSPFKCRVVIIDSYLSDSDYEKLILATTYAVNTAQAEGQCLPLMECMSVGKPAVAPPHTGMKDYLSTENAFLVASTPEPGPWPHDPRSALRVLHRRIDFESLLSAFEESYRVAKQCPDRYKEMAEQAVSTLGQHCSDIVTVKKFSALLGTEARKPQLGNEYGKLNPPSDIYCLGRAIDFAVEFDARKHLLSGWASTELGLGVWSHGPIAKLSFRITRRQTKALRLKIDLSAYVVPEHPDLSVRVSANNEKIAQWLFDIADPASIQRCWREARIPADLVWDGALCMTFDIAHPASPRKLGLSGDTRVLGIMLHGLSISPEAFDG